MFSCCILDVSTCSCIVSIVFPNLNKLAELAIPSLSLFEKGCSISRKEDSLGKVLSYCCNMHIVLERKFHMAEFIKRVFLKYITGYGDERKYWDTRWKLGLKNEEWDSNFKQKMTALMKNIMSQHRCKSFLEVGCGKANLRELPGYAGLDFSLESIKRSGLKKAIFADITNHIPLPDKSFDAVFTRYVLLHILPNKIENAAAEVSRVTAKCIILYEPPYEPNKPQVQPHSFNHNLPQIIRKYFNGPIIFLEPDNAEIRITVFNRNNKQVKG